MEAFRQLVAHYVAVQGKVGELFRIRNNAFDTFERARRAASPSTPLPASLVDGRACGATLPGQRPPLQRAEQIAAARTTKVKSS